MGTRRGLPDRAAGAWAYVAPPIDLVVNNSYVLSGLVGLGWLLAMLALEDQIRHVGEIAAIHRFVAWITDRSMSIYLWHTLALVLAFYLVGVPNSPGQYIILAAVFAGAVGVDRSRPSARSNHSARDARVVFRRCVPCRSCSSSSRSRW